jgi:tetratricopeptide (TPR) repeat protein
LEVREVRFDPVAEGKNSFAVQVCNLTDKAQVFAVHIQTKSAIQIGSETIRPGWGTQFSRHLAPKEEKSCRFVYRFLDTPNAESWVRLRFYNPTSEEVRRFEDHFQEVKRSGTELEARKPEAPPQAAPADVAEAVVTRFRQVQGWLREEQYEDVWASFTEDHRAAGFMGRLELFQSTMTREHPRFTWCRSDFLSLEPVGVGLRGDLAVLTADRGGEVWTIDFAQEAGEWRADWIAGYVLPLIRQVNWQDRLLPQLEKRMTEHFDIYYAKGSTAERDIDQIAERRESGYREMEKFLGQTADARIQLVFFEDERTKLEETGHMGMGWATGSTIVEVYNEDQRLDPYHETTHILAAPVGNPPALLTEGLAVYLSERLGAPALKEMSGAELSVYERVRQLKEAGEWIALERLLTYTEIGSAESQPPVAYAEAGAFAKFLVDGHGRDKFLEAYATLKNSSKPEVHTQNRQALERIYASSLDALDREWHAAMELPYDASAAAGKAVEPRRADMKPFWSPAEPLSATYVIDVRIDPEQETISGRETITLVNRSSAPIEQLAIRKGVWRAGSFTVEIDGERPPLSPSPEEADADTAILVTLPRALAPCETVEMEIDFRGPFPDTWEGLIVLREWHPRLWWGYPTHDDFQVSITAPEGWALAVSGRAEAPGGPWRASGVRSFGIVLDENLQLEEAEAGDTLIRCLFTPERRGCGEALLEAAVAAVDYYRSEFGFYPQPFLSIVPGTDKWMGGSPLAAGVVAIHGQRRFGEASDEWWRWIVAHEIGHQYWGEHVFDPDGPDWLWLGLGIYMDQHYVRARGLDESRRGFGQLFEAIEQGIDTTIERPPEQLADVDFDHNNIVRHGKGFAVISALESVLGRDTFRRIHDHCLAAYKGKCLGAREFQRVCEEQTGQDLSWFFDQWLRSNRYLGYRVGAVDKKQEGDHHITTVQVERFGSLEMPIPVEARFGDGSAQRATSDRLLRVSALRFESDAPVTEVVLDPDGALPVLEKPILDISRQIRELPWTGAGESALKTFELARESDLEGAHPWGKLGLTLYDSEYYTEALEAFGKTAEFDDPMWRPVALVWQGHILDLLGQREEAVARYKEAQKLPFPQTMRHDQYGIVINAQWIEERLKTPFQRKGAD